jgi:hypothetical protein
LWLLVSGLIREGCVGTVVPWILYVRHYLKRVITKGSLCSSDGSAQQWWQRAVEGRAMVVATPRQQAVVGQAARLSDGAPPHCQAAVGAVGGGVMTAIFGRRRRSGGLHRGWHAVSESKKESMRRSQSHARLIVQRVALRRRIAGRRWWLCRVRGGGYRGAAATIISNHRRMSWGWGYLRLATVQRALAGVQIKEGVEDMTCDGAGHGLTWAPDGS